jgi:two-component system chemotaxis sensor kinase CheA
MLKALLQEDAPAGTPAAAPAAAAGHPADGRTTYRIEFKPFAELYRNANEPLLLVRELKRMGTLTVECDTGALPKLSAIDTDQSYLSWVLHLTTASTPNDIAEVFEFVSDDCALTITALDKEQSSVAKIADVADEAQPTAAPPSPPPVVAAALPVVARKTPAATPATTTDQPATAADGQKKGAKGVSSIRVDLSRVDRLVNMVGELVISQAMLLQQSQDQSKESGLRRLHGQEELAARTRELQECVMAIRMQPVKSIFARMPRLVRDVSDKLGKKVRLVIKGEQTEVDKTIIEELADPLTHMIRNAIDHGIESPAVRAAAGKPEEGTIEISACHRGGNILIQIADDGAGIDRDRLLRKAIEKGIVPAGAKLTEEEIDMLIFAAGFSTAEKVTDVSGRGVGMDVVRRNISNLGGRIHVQSTLHRGTRFTLILPLTLAVLDGMLLGVGRERYVLPLTCIIEAIRPEQKSIRTILGGREVVSIRGEFIPLVYLYRIFDVPGAVAEPWKGLVVLVELENGAKIGIVVDEMLGQQQAVIKNLQGTFEPVAGVAGATILGNGRVALILDAEQLAACDKRAPDAADAASAEPAAPYGHDAPSPADAAHHDLRGV